LVVIVNFEAGAEGGRKSNGIPYPSVPMTMIEKTAWTARTGRRKTVRSTIFND
jgi:hypothetical protein